MTQRSRILAASREEARQLKTQRLSEVTPSRRDFAQFVATQRQELVAIARLSRPDGHWTTAQLVAHARRCDDAEVATLAVATGAGALSIADMAAVADATTAPILRDDLLIDSSQLYFARLHGADAVILPVAELDGAALYELVGVASSLHMASVIEVLSADQLDAALSAPHAIVGLRCLGGNGRIDLAGTLQLARAVPAQRTAVCLTEVHSPAECTHLRGACDAVVVGEVLAAADDIAAALQALLAV
jgi:indole-3-glycerol phosphate synthase